VKTVHSELSPKYVGSYLLLGFNFQLLLSYQNISNLVHLDGPPLWSSGQIRRPGFDFGHYRFTGKKKGKQVVGLERGPLSLVSTTEELLDRKVAAPV
jgi:hypothetical protein